MQKREMQTTWLAYEPKFPNEATNSATEVSMKHPAKAPSRLKRAHSKTAFLYFIAPQDTAVAMELGASVNPLTNKTPKIKTIGIIILKYSLRSQLLTVSMISLLVFHDFSSST